MSYNQSPVVIFALNEVFSKFLKYYAYEPYDGLGNITFFLIIFIDKKNNKLISRKNFVIYTSNSISNSLKSYKVFSENAELRNYLT